MSTPSECYARLLDYFVREIEGDDRFHTVFENSALRIIRVVQVPGVKEPSQKPLDY